jgi:hypothetical protein
MGTETPRPKRPDLLHDSVDSNGKSVMKLVEVTCPWPRIDYDGETLQKAYRKKVGKYDPLIAEPEKVYPNQKVEQATIVFGATGVFHKRSQVEFAKATRLQKKELARYQRNALDMAIQGSYQIFVGRMKCAKHNRDHPPQPEEIAILEEHEVDPMPAEDEEPIDLKLIRDGDITGIESYQASVLVHDVSNEEKSFFPPLKEHLDGHKDPEQLKGLRRNLDQV